ncbi:dinucleotide-utilizing enzyme [Microbacterium sp. CH12i]|uniref:hypothetical protein n=1 Tax=Microbacterium sp. CH12i TaxID=1479651 RepID=UPI0004615DE8|nr:hypothetical protein [Microbacterium sp. CH12i]KDA06210.1 dinucleotide-utilizing enzyme [Microbacterium sp. CH12i]
MKNMSLTRSIPYWLLLVLSLVSAAVGGFLVWDNISTMQKTLLDGTATNVEVYVGQAWITGGAALLGAGVLGVLLTLAIGAVKSLIPAPNPVVVEPIDWTAPDTSTASAPGPVEGSATEIEPETELVDATEEDSEVEDQNGSSGSIATATNSNVR